MPCASSATVRAHIGTTGFQRGDHLGDFPAFHLWSLEPCDRAVVLLDHDFDALPDLLQHSMHVAREISLGHMHGRYSMFLIISDQTGLLIGRRLRTGLVRDILR
jgi:hypothetical protein